MEENYETSSFWEPDFYKKTTKRIDDDYRLCNDFVSMLEERADIEKNYAKSLQSWSKKWQESVMKGPEQGDMEKGWLALMDEANTLSEIHLGIRQGLEEYVIENIKLWSKESYHKSIVNIKEKKDMDDLFKRIQKPWANQLIKVKKCKSLYYEACRNEKKSKKFKENGTLALSEEQIKKIDERIHKAQEETSRCRENYMKSIEELNAMSPKYLEEMKSAFRKSQLKESQRLKFFMETLVKLHRHINISRNLELPKIYEKYLKTVQSLDHEKDLNWWATYYGDKMPFKPPRFEEFFDVVEPIKKGNSLMKIVVGRENSIYRSTTMPKINHASSSISHRSKSLDTRESIVKHIKPVRVRAMYDYAANAFDELSLKEGEEFDRLEDEDELGWSKGLKDGKIGLYPANYVQVLTLK